MIERQLRERMIPFEWIYHEAPILRTVEDGAKYFGIDPGQTAPTLILHTDKGFHAAVVSGGRERVDFKAIKKLINSRDVRLATKDELDAMGLTIGNIPLLGLAMPYIVDDMLFCNDFVYGGTGRPHWTLKVSPKALKELNCVVGTLE